MRGSRFAVSAGTREQKGAALKRSSSRILSDHARKLATVANHARQSSESPPVGWKHRHRRQTPTSSSHLFATHLSLGPVLIATLTTPDCCASSAQRQRLQARLPVLHALKDPTRLAVEERHRLEKCVCVGGKEAGRIPGEREMAGERWLDGGISFGYSSRALYCRVFISQQVSG